MSGHRIPLDLYNAQNKTIPDPGASGTIKVKQDLSYVPLVTSGSESRTVAAPQQPDLRFMLNAKTIASGTLTITFTGGMDEAGTTTGTFSAAGQFAEFISVYDGSNLRWRFTKGNGFTGPVDVYDTIDMTTLKIGGTAVTATAAEINRAADMSARVVDCTSATLAVTEAEHDGKIITLNRAGGIAVTLPTPAAGMHFEFIVQTTFTGAASIKSAAGTHLMIGHALMGNDSDNTVVLWQATAASTYDTIDLFGTANSTGGIAGQRITIKGLSSTRWHVEMIGDAAGTEATPFADTVA